jgi:hypothetical protein
MDEDEMVADATDLVGDVERFIQIDVLGRMGPDPSGELAQKKLPSLLIVFANWRARFPPAVSRSVARSRELDGNPNLGIYRAEVEAIEEDIRSGHPLDRYLSRGVTFDYVPTGDRPAKQHRRRDIDGLMADWGIHHLHLSTIVESDGFVERSEYLLFVAFRGDAAYLIDIYPHESDSWADRDVLRTAVRNWPDARIIHPMQGAVSLAQTYTDEEYRALRNAGVSVAHDIDGQVYMALGQTTAGTPVQATQYSNITMNALKTFRNQLAENPTFLDDQLVKDGHDVSGGTTWRPYAHEGRFGVLGSVASDPTRCWRHDYLVT